LIEKILRTDLSLDFLLKLEKEEIEMLVVSIRGRIDQGEK